MLEEKNHGGLIVYGGKQIDIDDRYIEPTVVL